MPSGRPRYPGLTPREQEVYDLLRHGLTNREIAERMGISLDGAKYHVSQILMKLDVSTREEAVALTTKQRAFGLAGIGVLLRKLSLGGVAKTTTVAALSGALVLLALIAIGVFIAETRSDDEQPAPATGALPLTLGGQPSVFLHLLSHIPASDDSSLYFSDYAALRNYLGIQSPSQDAGFGEMTSYWSSLAEAGMHQNPISNAFTTGAATLNTEVGLNIANLDRSLHVRPNDTQCGSDTVFEGRFDVDRVEEAVFRTSSYRDDVTRETHSGVEYFSWPAGCVLLSSLGGPGSLVVGPTLTYWSGRSTAALQAMIDAGAGRVPTLADAAEYQLLAQEFADLQIFSAYVEVHADLLWFEPLRELAENEYGRNSPGVVEQQGYLRPYSGFAVGVGHDHDGTFAVLLLLHGNEQDASENAITLQTRVDSGTRYRGRPWSDTIVQSEIEADGVITRARFWGPDARFLLQAWYDLDSLFVSKP